MHIYTYLALLRVELKILYMPGKDSTAELQLQCPQFLFLIENNMF